MKIERIAALRLHIQLCKLVCSLMILATIDCADACRLYSINSISQMTGNFGFTGPNGETDAGIDIF